LDQDLPHPIDEVGEEWKIHHLRANILSLEKPPRPAGSKGQRHAEKHISPVLKNDEKTKLPI
jgi:hypothetical protein